MKSAPECFDCALNQCQRLARLGGASDEQIRQLLLDLARRRQEMDLNEPPSTATSRILLRAMELLSMSDPFKEIRQEQNRLAKEIVQKLRQENPDAKQALLFAAAGNVLDVGPQHNFNIHDRLRELQFARDDSEELFKRIRSARTLMYILDNAGEAVFDRLVLERIKVPDITIVARSRPLLNDITVDEARELGFDTLGRVIGSGSRYLGIDLNTVTDEFKDLYYSADVVIAKGHATFESLVDDGRDGFYLLTAKCELVARRLNVRLGQSVCYYSAGTADASPGR